MIVNCPKCGKQYEIEDARLPDVKSRARCKVCGGWVLIDPRAAAPAPGPGPDPLPPRTPESAPEDPAGEERAGEDFSAEDLFAVFPGLAEVRDDRLDLASIFASGREKGLATRRNRRAAAAIEAAGESLAAMLARGETVVKAALGDGYFPAEIPYANTILTLPANRFALFCTDRRLLAVNLDRRRRRPGEYFYQFPYADIRETGRGLFRDCLTIKSRCGRTMRFTGLTTTLSREFEDTIIRRRRLAAAPPAPPAPECLCPACFEAVERASLSCPACGAGFKSPATAFYRSLALPGLGAVYLRHRLLAAAEFAILAAIVAAAATAAALGLTGGVALMLCVLVLFMAASSALAFALGRKGLMLDRSRAERTREEDQPEDGNGREAEPAADGAGTTETTGEQPPPGHRQEERR